MSIMEIHVRYIQYKNITTKQALIALDKLGYTRQERKKIVSGWKRNEEIFSK